MNKHSLVNTRSISLIAGLLIACCPVSEAQDLESTYYLKGARVGLMNGQIQKGKLIAYSMDSLTLEDKLIAPAASIVYIRRRHTDKVVKVEVINVTETEILAKRVENQALMKFERGI